MTATRNVDRRPYKSLALAKTRRKAETGQRHLGRGPKAHTIVHHEISGDDPTSGVVPAKLRGDIGQSGANNELLEGRQQKSHKEDSNQYP
jgi:hypothetical protein